MAALWLESAAETLSLSPKAVVVVDNARSTSRTDIVHRDTETLVTVAVEFSARLSQPFRGAGTVWTPGGASEAAVPVASTMSLESLH